MFHVEKYLVGLQHVQKLGCRAHYQYYARREWNPVQYILLGRTGQLAQDLQFVTG